MLSKVNVTLLRQFLGFYCLFKHEIWLNQKSFFISLLLKIISSLNHIKLPLFMLSKENVTLLRQFPSFYCLSKLTIWLNDDAFFVTILCRIISSLNHI